MKNRYYIGLSCSFHDSSISIVNSKGHILFSEGSERYLQSKRAFNSPPDNFNRIDKTIKKYCDGESELILAKTWSKGFDFREKLFLWLGFTSSREILDWLIPTHNNAVNMAGKNLIHLTLDPLTKNRGLRNKVLCKSYDHHLTHAATACYTSPIKEAACAIVDGAGQKTSTNYYHFKNGKLIKIKTRNSINSLGLFYMYLCQWCGFDPHRGEEWKVMGLSSLGSYDDILYNKLKSLINVKGLSFSYPTSRKKYNKTLDYFYKNSISLSESPLKAANLAYNGQLVFEEVLTELLNNFYELKISDNLIMGGGCCLNSLFNGKIIDKTNFKKLHIFSAPADDGNSLGAALLAYYEDHPQNIDTKEFQSPYLGSELSQKTKSNLVEIANIPNMKRLKYEDIIEESAKLLSKGKILGWIHGKAEFGPRSLGNRSILADTRPKDMKDKINKLVKFREDFRPFAPSILHEFGDQYFENYQASPYMERALRYRKEVIEKIPAVVHADGTGRLQTVKREWNKKFYDLIRKVYELTSIPLVLNTSFNVMGRPIMHSIEDALGVFYSTGLDAIVIEDLLITKDC